MEIDMTGSSSWLGEERDDPPEYGYKIVVRSGNHRGDVFVGGGLVLGIEKIIHDTPGYDTLPVLLQEHITRIVYQK